MADEPITNLPIPIPEGSDGVIGYAGQMVSAVLQTAGIYGQAEVLDVFANGINSIGMLVYVFSAIGAITSVAIFGNYKKGLYFLLGPALFLWMLKDTVPASGTIWHFGERTMEDDPKNLMKLLRFPGASDPFADVDPKVSRFFAVYDNLVSSVVQNTVTLLVDTKNQDDVIYVARERMLLQMLRAQGTEERFIRLLAMGLMGDCGKQALLIHQLSRQSKRETTKALQERRKAELDAEKGKKVSLDSNIQKYVEGVIFYHKNKHSLPISAQGKKFLIPNADRYIKEQDGKVPEDVICEDLWRYVTLAAWKTAERHLTTNTDPNKYPGIPWEQVRDQVAAALTYDEKHLGKDHPELSHSSKVAEIVAAYIIRNTLTNNIYGNVAEKLESRSSWDPDVYSAAFGSVAWAEREVGRERIEYLAGTIPYIQGVLLFLLSLTFPFFTIFLLMPTHCKSFAVWVTLWLWVKSWDIGFAVTYFIRGILFQLMSNDPGAELNIKDMEWDRPDMIFSVMLQNDPLANLNTYYHIIALLTCSVPFITAHLCMGAGEVYSALKSSIDRQAILFSRRKGRAMRRMIATPIGRAIPEYEANYVLNAMSYAKQDQGKNIAGEKRIMKGDGTRPRYMDAVQKLAGVRSFFTDEQMRNKNYLAAVTGRKMTYDPGKARGAIDSMVGLMNEKHRGPNMGSQAFDWLPWLDSRDPSDKPGMTIEGLDSKGEMSYDLYSD